jgi:hypothetical protein
MAFVPFRSRATTAPLFPTFDRLFSNDAERVEEPAKGSPFSVGGVYYLAFCQVWAPPFDLDELDLLDDS